MTKEIIPKFFAIEGGDGSGKGTQAKLLADALRQEGKDVNHLSFPRYGQHSAYILEKYLRGEFGEAASIPAELASLAFTVDRLAAKPDIEAWFESYPDGVVISDRYVLSNVAHQAARIGNQALRAEFYADLITLEFEDLGLPRPLCNILLLVPPELAQQNVDHKPERSYTSDKRDVHESDYNHLANTNRNYLELAQLYPDFITPVQAYDNASQQMRPITDIADDIRKIIDET